MLKECFVLAALAFFTPAFAGNQFKLTGLNSIQKNATAAFLVILRMLFRVGSCCTIGQNAGLDGRPRGRRNTRDIVPVRTHHAPLLLVPRLGNNNGRGTTCRRVSLQDGLPCRTVAFLYGIASGCSSSDLVGRTQSDTLVSRLLRLEYFLLRTLRIRRR